MAKSIGLTLTTADGKATDFVFDSESILLGSGPSAALRVDDAQVSSIHAVIKLTAKGATIVDLGSEAGTTVNGSAAAEPVALKTNDEIGLGGAKLTIVSLVTGDVMPKAHELASEEATVQAERKVEPQTVSIQKPSSDGKKAGGKQVVSLGKEPKNLEKQGARKKNPGSNVVTETSEFNPALLTQPLDEANKPTNDEHVLQIQVLWGDEVLDEVQVKEPREVSMGGRAAGHGFSVVMSRSRPFDLVVETPLADNFTIARNLGTEAQVVVPASATVGLRKSDGTVTKEVALQGTDAPFPAKAYQLKMGERLVYKFGTMTVVSQFVRGNAKLGKGAVMDWYFPRVFAISALLHIFFVVAAFMTPPGSGGLADDLLKNNNRFANMLLKAPEEEKKTKKLDLSGSKGGAKHKDEEGKFGKKDKPQKDALASKAGAPRVDPNKREKDRKIALNSGLLGILKGAGEAGAVSNVFGPGGLGTGINNAMGGLRGSEMGDAGGAGGLGTRGTGAGGGGNSLGIGGLGTHGHGRGTGGYGNIDLGGRGKGTTRIVPGKTIIQGSLSKEDIARVIRRNLARFKYCYEKELNANPNLSGKIAVYFTIAPTGSVAEASVRETSMNDTNVEECVVKVMRSLKFPEPKGGGIVVVTYPFVFNAA